MIVNNSIYNSIYNKIGLFLDVGVEPLENCIRFVISHVVF